MVLRISKKGKECISGFVFTGGGGNQINSFQFKATTNYLSGRGLGRTRLPPKGGLCLEHNPGDSTGNPREGKGEAHRDDWIDCHQIEDCRV